MSPITHSLLSRPLCSTLRKTPCVCGPQRITKTYFTPNRLRGGTHRPFFNHTFQPVLCNCPPPPTIPLAKRSFSPTPNRSFGTYTTLPHYLLKLSISCLIVSVTFLAAPVIYCEPPTDKTGSTAVSPSSQGTASPSGSPPLPPPPQSSLNLYELTFGTVCGICAGVFVKKGAKMVAFAVGGVFVLLQYLGSWSLVRVDWGRAASRFETAFYRKDALGVSRPPNVGSMLRGTINFLTADFQPRASFVAGFMLGLRVG